MIVELQSILSFVLILFITLVELSSCEPEKIEHILLGRSFFIRSAITYNDVESTQTSNLVEFYSSDQKRARIHYDTLKEGDTPCDFIYDSESDLGIAYFPKVTICDEYDLDRFYADLFEYLPEVRNLFRMADDEIGSDDIKFVVGPAKLLFLIAMRSEYIKVREVEKNKDELIRSNRVVIVDLDIEIDTSSGEVLHLSIYYNRDKRFAGYFSESLVHDAVPLQIGIESRLTKKQISISFFHFQLSANGIKTSSADFLDDRNADRAVDVLSFPLAANCSRFLPAGRLYSRDLLSNTTLDRVKFSFNTETLWATTFKVEAKHFIAFDGFRSSLRIDTQRKPGTLNQNTLSILDYSANRRYIMVENPDYRAKSSKDSDLALGKLSCVPIRIDPYKFSKQQRLKWDLLKFLTGSSQFTYMGRARVGSAPALVYEGYAEALPTWFSQPTIFKDSKSIYWQRELGWPIRMVMNKEPSGQYGVLLYIADRGQDRQSLDVKILMLEFYNLNHSLGSSSRRILTSKFTNFIWDLSEAPNGDHANELFSRHYDICVETSNQNKYTRVEMILESDNINDPSKLDWLKEWAPRQEALVNSLADLLYLQSFLVHDLETKLISEPKRTLVASFNLAEGPKTMYQIKFLGNVALSAGTSPVYLITTAHSLGECLWMVGGHKQVYLFYFELTQTCIVLPPGESDPIKSGMFIYQEGKAGELYTVEAHEDDSSGKSWISKQGIMYMQNKPVELVRPNAGESIDAKATMRIKSIKVPSLNYLETDDKLAIQKALTFPGIDLTQSSSYKRFSFSDAGESGKQMSVTQCKAACLKEVECQSYSYCAQLPEFKCTLSRVRFQQPGIIEKLNSATSGRKIRLQLPLATVYSDAERAGGSETEQQQVVELVRDRKCELHNKVYLDMFQRHWVPERALKGLQIYGVVDRDQCAQICFRRSLESLEANGALMRQLRQVLDKGNEDVSQISKDEVDEDRANVQLIEKLRRNHSQALSQFCSSFFYLDSSVDGDDGLKVLSELNLGPVDSVAYCALADHHTNEVAKNDTAFNKARFHFTEYKFDFLHIYERKFGYYVGNSPLTWEEAEAARLAKTGAATEEQLALIRRSIIAGRNFKVAIAAANEAECAESCFSQSTNIWPACRSFDVQTLYPRDESPQQVCYLNTLSLGIKNADMRVKIAGGEKLQTWHYEPLFGLVSDEMDLEFALVNLREVGRRVTGDSPHFLARDLLLRAILILLGLISGLILGVQLTHLFEWILVNSRAEGDKYPLAPRD